MNVSVIIPLYNAEKYIAKAIESCLALDEVKEIIVIDDGYPDNGRHIVLNYVKVYDFIKLLDHSENGNLGAGASRNLGILKATQDYIAFLDADDYYLPNRFKKDKEVFGQFLDADGCYNSIAAYFYSEEAKIKYFKSFRSEVTTVNPNVHPTPMNLFSGLLGRIPNYGHFHLNGLTIKKKSLTESLILFGNLKIHQDTVFLIKIAYCLKLYPSELDFPVANRGVHDENRIINNFIDKQINKDYRKFLMWNEILNWSKKNKINKTDLNFIINRCDFFRIISKKNMNYKIFIIELIKSPHILKSFHYPELHRNYFKEFSYSYQLFRIRNLIIKIL